MLTYTQDCASACVHCFNILYSSSRAVHWLMGYSLLRWCTVINADSCKRVSVKETDRKERGRGQECAASANLPRSRSLTFQASCINPPLSPSFPAPLIQPLYLHMLHSYQHQRLNSDDRVFPSWAYAAPGNFQEITRLCEMNQHCACVCVYVCVCPPRSALWEGCWHVCLNVWPGFSCCLNVV